MACCGVKELERSEAGRSCWDAGDVVDALDRIWVPFMPSSYGTKSWISRICDRGGDDRDRGTRSQFSA